MKLRGSDASERERTVIERQVTHLTRLVDDLLDVSRIARGKVELKEELCRTGGSGRQGDRNDQSSRSSSVRTRWIFDVPRSGLPIRGDATRLSQVISNLLTNAAKYTPAGGHITVRGTEEDGQVVLRVRDTGIGIAPDVLPHVFDLFVQERQALDRSQGGLGLGLTIVRNLVEHHGGSVSAYSQGPRLRKRVRRPAAEGGCGARRRRSLVIANAQGCLPVPTSSAGPPRDGRRRQR